MSQLHVLVVGSGIAGPCLAQALLRAGMRVSVFERDAGLGRGGYRLHMNADGGNALQACLPPELYELYLETSRRNPRRELAVMLDEQAQEIGSRPHIGPPNDGPRPHTAVNRHTLRQILFSGLANVVQYGKVAERYELLPDAVRVIFSDGTSAEGDVLVGADGIHSRVRAQYLPDVQIRDSGMRMIYCKAVVTPEQIETFPAPWHDGFVGMTDSENGFLGMGLFVPRQPIAAAPADIAPQVQLDPVADYVMLALGLISEQAPTHAELSRASGPELKALVESVVTGWHPRLVELVAGVDPDSCFYAVTNALEEPKPWQPSRVTLLGDAIHAMPPSFGAGANLALRDAASLAEHLVQVQRGERGLIDAIGAFEAEMRDYVFPVMRAAVAPQLREPGGDYAEKSAEIADRFRKDKAMAHTRSLSGRWALVIKTPMGDQKFTLDLLQDGSAIRGSAAAEGGDTSNLEDGRVDGSDASWNVHMSKPFKMKLHFTLSFTGDAVSGKVKAGMFPASVATGQRLG